jgi:hypothetical protein
MRFVLTVFAFTIIFSIPAALWAVDDFKVSDYGGELLFSVGGRFQDDLDSRTISQDLRDRFKNNKISLSQNARISIMQRGSKWQITDGQETYAIRKEEGELNIYQAGHQIWFEAEAFDERSPSESYKLGDGEGALKPKGGAFGDIVTNVGGQGWLLYRFDISRTGGKGGPWRFCGRVINPENHSDWLWVLGDDGDEIPEVDPGFVRPDDIIFENDTPNWAWVTDGDFGEDGGTVNELQDGENVMMIWYRQSSLQVQYDVFMWTDVLDYRPTDEDYINATPKSALAVTHLEKLPTLWGKMKSE